MNPVMSKTGRVMRGCRAGMTGVMLFNWELATASETVVLYEAIRDLLRPKGLTWVQVFEEAYPGITVGTDYERNLRRGKIAPQRAKQLFLWLQNRFPETAAHVDALLASAMRSIDSDSAWERFIEERGAFTNVEIKVIEWEDDLPADAPDIRGKITTERWRQIKAQYEIKLHKRFTFRIDSPLSGYLLVLQWSRGIWWPVPLSNGQACVAVEQGEQWLPYDPEYDSGDLPELLSEHTEPGLHRLVFLLSRAAPALPEAMNPEQRVDPAQIDQLAARFQKEPGSWRLFRLNVMFKALDTP